MKDAERLSELLKTIAIYWDYAKPHELERIIKTIFSELSIYENTLNYQVTNGFEPIKIRLFANCAGGETRLRSS